MGAHSKGQPLADAGPLGLLLVSQFPPLCFLHLTSESQGYAAMSSVVYGMVVSSAEMVAVYPYCRGTVGLADRFVDPALGKWNSITGQKDFC